MTERVWAHVLTVTTEILLTPPGPQIWHLRVDWSGTGTGYAIWAGPPNEGRLMGIGSVKFASVSASMLGELRALVWALKQTNELTTGQQIVVETDSESAYKRIRRPSAQGAVEDVRILRLLEWLTANYGGRLQVNFIPSEDNELADLLSRWSSLDAEKSITDLFQPQLSQAIVAWIPSEEEKLRRFQLAHTGHWGTQRSWLHLRRDGPIWPGARRELFDFVARCRSCQHFTDPTESEVWSGLYAEEVGQIVTADFFGPLRWRQGRRKYGLLLIDAFSRYVQILPCVAPTAKNVLRGLQQWKARFEVVGHRWETLLTDNGAGFIAVEVRNWTQWHRIVHLFSAPYAPWSNGLAERVIGTIKGHLQRMGYEGRIRPPEVEDIVNSAVHRATGYTPNELVYGQRRSGDVVTETELQQWRNNARVNQQRLRQETVRKWQKKKRRKGQILQPGDIVLLFQPEKRHHTLESSWMGPYRLRSQLNRVQWILESVETERRLPGVYHANKLKLFRSAQGSDVAIAVTSHSLSSRRARSVPPRMRLKHHEIDYKDVFET